VRSTTIPAIRTVRSAYVARQIGRLVLAAAVSRRWMEPGDRLHRVSGVAFGPRLEALTWGATRAVLRVAPGVIHRSLVRSLLGFGANLSANRSIAKLERDGHAVVRRAS
jgi:hypothetical protein